VTHVSPAPDLVLFFGIQPGPHWPRQNGLFCSNSISAVAGSSAGNSPVWDRCWNAPGLYPPDIFLRQSCHAIAPSRLGQGRRNCRCPCKPKILFQPTSVHASISTRTARRRLRLSKTFCTSKPRDADWRKWKRLDVRSDDDARHFSFREPFNAPALVRHSSVSVEAIGIVRQASLRQLAGGNAVISPPAMFRVPCTRPAAGSRRERQQDAQEATKMKGLSRAPQLSQLKDVCKLPMCSAADIHRKDRGSHRMAVQSWARRRYFSISIRTCEIVLRAGALALETLYMRGDIERTRKSRGSDGMAA
jgi:hypothetical protein